MKPQITFYGGVNSVTGANFLFEAQGKKILIDCGLEQGGEGASLRNGKVFPYSPATIDFLFITHAHMDHIGLIPKLVKEGFTGRIFSTPETKEITRLMLEDAHRIMEYEARNGGESELYSLPDLERAISIWETIDYHKNMQIAPELSVVAKDAGHILGSAMYEFEYEKGERVLFTGDLGNSPSVLMPDTEFVNDADYIVMESVYGDRNHESKEERDRKFKDEINSAINKGGTVLIPAFSLERTQTLLYELNELIESKAIDEVPVFLDSPLAISLTKIYRRMFLAFKKDVQTDIKDGDEIFEFKGLKETPRADDSKSIASQPGPKIIIAGSGMSTAGRILHHEKRYLPDSNATVLITGYQSPGTLGRQIEEGAKEVEIEGSLIPVRARIVKIEGFSGHRDSDHLLEFVEKAADGPLKQVYVVMGEPKASQFLAQRINDYIGVKAICPEAGKTYVLK